MSSLSCSEINLISKYINIVISKSDLNILTLRMIKEELQIKFPDTDIMQNKTEINNIIRNEIESQDNYKTWTITFSESVENHVGMEQIGNISTKGISIEEINNYSKYFTDLNCEVELIDLQQNLPEKLRNNTNEAKLLIVRGGIKKLLNQENDFDKFVEETKNTEKIVDTKAWMRGRVVNKLARYNLCYSENSQTANYEEKKGTIVAFDDVVYLQQIRNNLGKLGDRYKSLFAELNYYYDNRTTGISFH